MMQIATLIPIIVGLSQVLKNIGLPGKYIPLLNIVLGIAISLLAFENLAWNEQILQGLIVGLSAGGIYDQSKNLNQAFAKSDEIASTDSASS